MRIRMQSRYQVTYMLPQFHSGTKECSVAPSSISPIKLGLFRTFGLILRGFSSCPQKAIVSYLIITSEMIWPVRCQVQWSVQNLHAMRSHWIRKRNTRCPSWPDKWKIMLDVRLKKKRQRNFGKDLMDSFPLPSWFLRLLGTLKREQYEPQGFFSDFLLFLF